MKKPILILIQSTDATISGFKEKGLWDRQYFTIQKYTKEFDVWYYTSDYKLYQKNIPEGSVHKISKFATSIYGLRHIVFYIYLIKESFNWKKQNTVIRVFGVNIPFLPFFKFISKKKIVSSFQYDWAKQTNQNYNFKDIKKYLASYIQYNSLKYSDIVIATMPWLKYIVKKTFLNKPVTIIPNYVNIKEFFPLTKKKQIVFAGRLHWSKGIDTLINAFIEFNKNNQDYMLIILGDGEEREKLEKLSQNNKNIFFKGNVAFNEVATYFNESEIFVLPTRTMEGHPKALIEAMASGCKCIASNVAGNKDVLEECNTKEYIFNADHPEELLEKLYFAKNDDKIYKNQFNFAKTNYDAELLFEKEIKLLKNLKDRDV